MAKNQKSEGKNVKFEAKPKEAAPAAAPAGKGQKGRK